MERAVEVAGAVDQDEPHVRDVRGPDPPVDRPVGLGHRAAVPAASGQERLRSSRARAPVARDQDQP